MFRPGDVSGLFGLACLGFFVGWTGGGLDIIKVRCLVMREDFRYCVVWLDC